MWMSLTQLITIVSSVGEWPVNTILLLVTIATALAMRSKVSRKEMCVALEKKADKDAIAEFKEFIQSRFDAIQSRCDDIKTLAIELARKK